MALPLSPGSAMLNKMSEIQHSGATNRGFQRRDYVKITIFGFALTALWQSMHMIILPLRILDFVGEAEKNTYLGLLTLVGLLLAMLVQPIAGAISDRSHLRWGRRRPFILLGTLIALLLLPGIGFLGSYAAFFIIYCLLQLSTNTAQGPYQAFIPDMVPAGKRGLASGVKFLLEILGGVALLYPIAIFMDRYFRGEGILWLGLVLGILGVVMLVMMSVTIVTVRETPQTSQPRIPLLTTLRHAFKIDLRTKRSFLWFLLSRLLIFMAFATIQQFALNYLRDVIGVTRPAEATARFSIVVVGTMLAMVYPAGYFSDRIGRKPINIIAGLLGAVGVAVIFLSQDYGPILIAAGILGAAIGAFNSTNWALATDLLAKDEEARYLGLTNMATAGGAALARLIGPVIDVVNRHSEGMGYQVMLLACFIYFVAGAMLVVKIKQ